MRILLVAALRVGDADLGQHLDGGLLGLRALQALMVLDALLDLLADFLQRVQAGHRVLHDHGDLLAAHAQPVLLGELGHVAAFVHDGAAGDLTVDIQHTHEGLGEYGLARAGLAHDGQRLAVIKVQRALADRVQLLAAQAKGDLHVFGRDDRLSIHFCDFLSHLLNVVARVSSIRESVAHDIEGNGDDGHDGCGEDQQVRIIEEEAAHLAQDEAQRRSLDAQTDAQIG